MVDEKVLNKLHEEIVKNRTEIRNCIEASEARLLLKIEELKNRLNSLEQQNSDLQNKIEILERTTRKNNIVVFGLHNKNGQILAKSVTGEISKLLNITLTEADLNNIYTLGKTENSPIKIEFLSYLKKLEVIKNCSKLKGTSISVVHDLTQQQREENRILRKHLILAKQNGNKKCYIKKSNLYVGEEVYTAEQLKEQENFEEDEVIINSAPTTPTVKQYQQPQKRQQEFAITHATVAAAVAAAATSQKSTPTAKSTNVVKTSTTGFQVKEKKMSLRSTSTSK